ncbi:hypothetical protein PsorP6_004287 [Peronosclerospora sorghi]|uniref:Uncharacterized protein n=1 Tax=Peronosclerospora sorghi TaxID=230839 RepID=A0ACC0VLB2_9STRA|nr:hypothetical protein PsorP6_004287 [Peronosclerospora sorghi]
MYSGDVAHIYNPYPDPLEYGPPKRIIREEQHIGEMVAASKKRLTWRFTLGESDRTHEVVLIHSVMSYKKAMLGDWSFTMILDGLKLVMEVRINEKESDDIPKYDFLIDRVPFRRWDVYRRKKHTIAYAHSNASSGSKHFVFKPSSMLMLFLCLIDAYGKHWWGPNGAVPSSQNEQPYGSYSTREVANVSSCSPYKSRSPTSDHTQILGHQRARFRTSSAQSNGRTCSFSGPQNGQQDLSGEQLHNQQRASLRDQSNPLTSRRPHSPSSSGVPELKKQPDINLIDDLGPSVSVSAQSLLFDPLAGVSTAPIEAPAEILNEKLSSTRDLTATSAAQQQLANRPIATVSQYVDPFASVAKPVMAEPFGSVSLDPLATSNVCTYQQRQQIPQIPPSSINLTMGYQQHPMVIAMGAPMGGLAINQQVVGGPSTRQQLAARTDVNNISQLLDPASVQTRQQDEKGKSIDIDAFAGVGR